MSRLLLDSHLLLWLLYKPSAISSAALETMQSANALTVSVISLWELAIKHKKGKLRFATEDLIQGIEQLGLTMLPCLPDHITAYKNIELPHKDPFDTILIAQAKQEGLTLLTADQQLLDSEYPTLDARP